MHLASPRWVLGRNISMYYVLIDGGIAAVSWVSGTVAQSHGGFRGSLVAGCCSRRSVFLFASAAKSELDPLEEFDTPAVALELKSRSGRIVVKVEYVIPEENVEAFLDLLRVRRHVQGRMGWTPLRSTIVPKCRRCKARRVDQ
ncbi:MFS transporter [Mesorhizobium sp.]|uniref:MFS transporter n=1 Tax=Mesorhizobium sp. TaxID=1871066 RepID=UPI00257DBC6D|nr:MFS transporter [Mesorhizobium sp.]